MQSPRFWNAAIAAATGVLSFALIAFPNGPARSVNSEPLNQPNGDARVLFDAANRERAAAGTPALEWDASLARAARAHADLLAGGEAFEHQLPGEPGLPQRASAAGAHFSYISENIAEGPDPESIHVGWMHSPGHRGNLLSRKVNAVGIAVVARGKQLYAVEDFAHLSADLSPEDQEKSVKQLLKERGWRISDSFVDEARKVCLGAPPPRVNMSLSILRFETPDLERLPAAVERDLRSHRPGTAAVGACAAVKSGGFIEYHVAVLLY